MILYYFPVAQNTVNKTVSDKFYRCIYLSMNEHIMYYFSIDWSDTSLELSQQLLFFLKLLSAHIFKYTTDLIFSIRFLWTEIFTREAV